MKLRELLEYYEFEWYDKDAPRNFELNTRTVRIYLGGSVIGSHYFEIGRSADCCLENIVMKEILDSRVMRFYADDYLDIMCVHIAAPTLNEDEDDDN